MKYLLASIFFIVLIFCSCSPDYNNPYDPDILNPYPLMPQNITVKNQTDSTVTFNFKYEYASHSQIEVRKNGFPIAIVSSGRTFIDNFAKLSEDVIHTYTFIGFNDFGENRAEAIDVKNAIPPRVNIEYKVDTISGTIFLYGTVEDISDVGILKLDNENVALDSLITDTDNNIIKYFWEYSLPFHNSKDEIFIYVKDKSVCCSDTSFIKKIYW